jgi:hypothetical protein
MGFLAEELGFANAVQMVAHMKSSLDGQIDCMVREIKKSHLVEPLNSRDFQHVARVYNGPSYQANAYDTKLASACVRWERKLLTFNPAAPVPPEQLLSVEQIRAIQTRLIALGYVEVGLVDGRWGSKLTGAISAFQDHEHLTVSGHYTLETENLLMHVAAPREVAPERKEVTADDLAKAGSKTIADAKKLSGLARLLQLLGLGGAATAVDSVQDALHGVKESIGGDLKSSLTSVSDVATWMAAHWWIAALLAGLVLSFYVGRIIKARVADHQTGKSASPGPVEV